MLTQTITKCLLNLLWYVLVNCFFLLFCRFVEFRISIFHPYGESSSIRSGSSSWGDARPCDSLTILVKDIQCHLSRTVEAKVVQVNPNTIVNESNSISVPPESNKKPFSSTVHSARETMVSVQSVDNFGLHRNLCISGTLILLFSLLLIRLFR